MLSASDKKFLQETFATKKELADLKEYSRETFATKKDLAEVCEYFTETFVTKNEFLTGFDAIMVELRAIREELTVIAYRQSDHSDRLEILENKVGV